ncbi:MAG: DUF4221 family protein [Bacteroidales bacterium]
MNKIKFIPCLIFALLLSSCKNDGKYRDLYTLNREDSVLVLPVGRDSKNLSFCIEYYSSDGINYLAVANHKKYSIEIYDLNRRVLANIIHPGLEGNNAFAPFSFLVKNHDTIIGFQINALLGIINDKGEVIKRITFDRDHKGRVNYFAQKIGGGRPLLKDNIVYLVQEYREHENKGILTSQSLSHTNVNTCVDLISGEVTTSTLTYPPELVGMDVSGMETCRAPGYKGVFVYHFRLLDALYLTYDHVTFKKIPLETNYKLNLEEEHWRYIYDMPGAIRYMLGKDEVQNIYYDEFRECYYIFVRQRYTDFNNKTDFVTKFMYPHCFVIILDKNLKHLGEVYLPDNTYSCQMVFLTPDGLFISEDHPNNPAFDEDYMRFRLFKLKKL